MNFSTTREQGSLEITELTEEENSLTGKIIGAAIDVHRTLGPGLLESVYEGALAYELRSQGLVVTRQMAIPVIYNGVALEEGFRADLIVQGKVIVELKSLDIVPPVAYKVLLTYLRLADIRLGLLINFGEEHLKDGIKRVVNKLSD